MLHIGNVMSRAGQLPNLRGRLVAVAALSAAIVLGTTACATGASRGPSATVSTPGVSEIASASPTSTETSTASGTPSTAASTTPSLVASASAPTSPFASPAATSTAGIDQSILAQLPSQFVFASGAGGWATVLTMGSDGTFTGNYLDADMGDVGSDYPNGTVDESNFSGVFAVTAQVSQSEYQLRLTSLTVQSPTGTSTIKDGTKYVYQDPYGFDKAQDFSLYLPGRATADLPQAFIGWAQGSQGWNTVPATLPCWGLYNIGGQEGFTSQDN